MGLLPSLKCTVHDARAKMKLNVSYPANGTQKMIEMEDEIKLRFFYGKRMAQEVSAECLGEQFKGYIVRISGGNDKQGFPMMQGVMTNGRVRLLLNKDHKTYRARRTGERKRISCRGCIVDSNLSVLNLVVVKKGDEEIPGLTDRVVPRRLGPKRVGKIRKLFNLMKDDDVRQYIIRRPLPQKEGETKIKMKSPAIQRLVTPVRLQRKRAIMAKKRMRAQEKARAANSRTTSISSNK